MTTVIAWRYFPELFDLILVSLEISAWFYLGLSKLVVGRSSTDTAVILAVTLYALMAGLCLTLVFRVACILRSGGRKLLEPFNLFSGCESPPSESSRHQVLFGRNIWKSAFRGEAKFVRVLRGVLAISFLFAVLAFSAFLIIIDPIHETGLVPTKDYRAPDILYDFNMELPVWSIVAFIDMRLPIASRPDVFKSAISVIPLWDNSSDYKPDCVPLPGNLTVGGKSQNVQSDPYIQAITIFCPSRRVGLNAQEIMSAPSPDVSPDLLVTINFTTLGMFDDSLVDARMRTVSILVGLTNNTNDVVANTIPTPMFPGLNLAGNISREFKRRFVKPPLASWGIFSSSTSFLVTGLSPLFYDPSSLIPRSPDTGTLRIFGQNDHSDWELHQDYRDKSVWSGLASVGGFWTFLNGAFGIIFGTRLVLILFGIKPGSIFGIAHLFQRQRPADEHQENDIHQERLPLQITRTSRSTSPRPRN